jgi:hypothetical protein
MVPTPPRHVCGREVHRHLAFSTIDTLYLPVSQSELCLMRNDATKAMVVRPRRSQSCRFDVDQDFLSVMSQISLQDIILVHT